MRFKLFKGKLLNNAEIIFKGRTQWRYDDISAYGLGWIINRKAFFFGVYLLGNRKDK